MKITKMLEAWAGAIRAARLLPGLLLLAASAVAQAQYHCTTNAGAITITRYVGAGGNVTVPDMIDGLPVTSIGYNAFWNCTNLLKVVIPGSVASIQVRAFGGCVNLAEVVIPEGAASIGIQAFQYCSSLTEVAIPASVSSIGMTVFFGCSNLAAITVAEGNANYSSSNGVLFDKSKTSLITCPGGKTGSYAIPAGVAYVNSYAFFECTKLTEVTIPDNLICLGVDAFRGCSGLTHMRIPGGVSFMGVRCIFSNCNRLVDFTVDASNSYFCSVDGVLFDKSQTVLVQCPGGRVGSYAVPSGIAFIEEAAFSGCANLTDVSIPESVIRVSPDTWVRCPRLTSITVNASNNALSSVGGVLMNKDQTEIIRYPTGKTGAYTIPAGVTRIADNAFAECTNLSAVVIPDGVSSIGGYAFGGCTRLTGVNIPASTTSIGDRAFDQCLDLDAITVDSLNASYSSFDGVLFDKAAKTLIGCPNGKTGDYVFPLSVTNISDYAFFNSRLASLTIPAGVTLIKRWIFFECSELTTLYFLGNPPALDWSELFTPKPSTVYYMRGTTGWGTTWGGFPAVLILTGQPLVLPPFRIAKKSFVARWQWVDGGAPEGELSVASDAAFTQLVPGYETRYAVNSAECWVTNLLADQDYWYRVRGVMSDGRSTSWSPPMKARTGKGVPVLKNLLSEGPVAQGICQEFALSNLVSGVGTLKVKSSNTNAVKVAISAGVLTLQYLWKDTNTANVTMTLTHPATGYKASYRVPLSRSNGKVIKVGESVLTNAGIRVVQDVTLENQTGETIYGVRLRAHGLDNPSWLINRTGLDPISKSAIREVPCVLPAGSQMVVRLVFKKAYKAQAITRPVRVAAWPIVTPVHDAMPPTGERAITSREWYAGLWLLGVPVNRNRLYTVYHSDDDGATWTLKEPVIRASSSYLIWVDTDEAAPPNRLYRVLDSGM